MPEFLPAEVLREEFVVFGHFYSVDLRTGEHIECRSDLEIISQDFTPSNPDSLLDHLPDGIFIMMNPGSSAPVVPVDQPVPGAEIDQLVVSLVPAAPDSTQFQVMRVMHYLGWRHVRIINLSDLRNAKSGSFVKQFELLEHTTGYIEHSLFTDKRGEELKKKLPPELVAPIVLGWGVNEDLDPLIQRCMDKVGSLQGITGIVRPGSEDKYLHPLPALQSQKREWVDQILQILGGDMGEDMGEDT
jgi:hypothetical protein